MEATQIIIAIVGGFVAGIINTLAGYGSVLTLAIYMDILGLPGHIANTTNRVNVFFSSNIASLTFLKKGKLNIKGDGWIIIFTLIGVIAGAICALKINAEQFKNIFNYLLIPILILLLTNPKRFLQNQIEEESVSRLILIPLFIAVGFYAGFIQAGFGIIFLIIIVLLGKRDLIHGNALKIAIVAIYSWIVVCIFWYKGAIMWKYALVLSIGQAAGGYFTAHYLSSFKSANVWAYRLIIIIIVGVLIKNFELYSFLI